MTHKIKNPRPPPLSFLSLSSHRFSSRTSEQVRIIEFDQKDHYVNVPGQSLNSKNLKFHKNNLNPKTKEYRHHGVCVIFSSSRHDFLF